MRNKKEIGDTSTHTRLLREFVPQGFALRYSRSLVKLSAPEHTPDEKGGKSVALKSHDFHVI
jgi:hypothetical protein